MLNGIDYLGGDDSEDVCVYVQFFICTTCCETSLLADIIMCFICVYTVLYVCIIFLLPPPDAAWG